MLRRADLYDLIDVGEIPAVFEKLTKFFPGDELTGLIETYTNHPDNYSELNFRRRLKTFIVSKIPADRAQAFSEDDFYDALCKLDFKVQTDNFIGIYQHKRVTAYLLHGENGPEGKDIRWLYNQLLYKAKAEGKDRYCVVDCNALPDCSFDDVLNELFIEFNVDTTKEKRERHMVLLSKKIEAKLKEGPYACIFKKPSGILGNENELRNMVEQFIRVMNQYIDDDNYPFLLFFVEENLAEYDQANDNYFFWYKEEKKDSHSADARESSDIKIIDLAPIGNVGEADIVRWINEAGEKPAIWEKIKCFKGGQCNALENGNKPYQVINKICTDLKIKIDPKWII